MPLSVLNLFRQTATPSGFSPVHEAARRDWNERYSLHEQDAKRWRLASFCSFAIAFLAVGGVGYIGAQSKYTPYVVERDHLGDEVRIGPAELASPCDARVIQAEINRWIHDVRNVSSDGLKQHDVSWEAYRHTDKSGPAAGKLDEWGTKNDPFKRAKEVLVETTIISTLPRDLNNWKSWVSKWRENTWSRTGQLETSDNKEISVEVSCKHPTTETEFQNNVSGVFIHDFNWDK